MAGIGKLIGVPKPLVRKLITFSGTVKVEGSFAARRVGLYKQATGELAGSTLSNLGTGVWEISVSDNTNVKYFAVCIPEAGTRNAEVFAHITGV
jgi:hypothetical protein